MKILQLIQKSQLRGAEIFACQLSTQLNNMGVETVLVTLFDGDAILPYSGKIVNLSADKSKRIADIHGWKKLAEIIKRENPDIIQSNAGDTLKYAVFSRLLFRWKQPIIFRNASTVSRYIKSSFAKKWNNWLYQKTSLIVSVSDTSKEDFLRLFPNSNKKISVIPIGVDLQELELKKESNSPIIIHVGGFTFEKNHGRLLYIYSEVLKRYPKAILWLVGNGPLKKKIEMQVQEMGLENKVVFYGAQSGAIQLIRQADVLLLPSIIEGLPGVILESFLAKTPVVAYNVGGIKEVVNKETGWLISANDEQAFVEAIGDVFDDTRATSNKVEKAYELVATRYTNDSIAKRFNSVYKQLID